MTEEEYFRKNYPDSCYGDKPLSPHFDFFQDGVEFGERQTEKRITELEKENAELQYKLKNLASVAEVRLANWQKYEKENAELKEYNKYLRRKRQGGIQKQYNKVAIIKQQKEQLTKAIGIIKRWYETNSSACIEPSQELIEVTEQFLSEVEK